MLAIEWTPKCSPLMSKEPKIENARNAFAGTNPRPRTSRTGTASAGYTATERGPRRSVKRINASPAAAPSRLPAEVARAEVWRGNLSASSTLGPQDDEKYMASELAK